MFSIKIRLLLISLKFVCILFRFYASMKSVAMQEAPLVGEQTPLRPVGLKSLLNSSRRRSPLAAAASERERCINDPLTSKRLIFHFQMMLARCKPRPAFSLCAAAPRDPLTSCLAVVTYTHILHSKAATMHTHSTMLERTRNPGRQSVSASNKHPELKVI